MAASAKKLAPLLTSDGKALLSQEQRLRLALAGRTVVRVGDLWEELGLDRYAYLDTPLERVHIARLLEAGYRPVAVPVLSGTHVMYLFVREAWDTDANAPPVRQGFQIYLETGDPLLALLVGRAERAARERN